MGMLGMINCFTMRACLNVAINSMVRPPQVDIKYVNDSCPYEDAATTTTNSSSSDSGVTQVRVMLVAP